ncbi:hypothetical protein [Effusibacillus dendaii]|uniref:Uncharacterized protein n=1 Tax=Effusibacillus dendaii TaxID=2743772 RepID=A0A7I8D8Z3_9BACL|nr:hypothetical protein [Effusibacillus dendaii]BCJ85286.1 hypothetical protein skT53_02710 [Effusibacillus dendaii]
MKPKKENRSNFIGWASVAGFAIGFAASLLGGNLLWTSLQRGLVGFVFLLFLSWGTQLFFSLGKTADDPKLTGETNADSAQTALGQQFDVSLPPESFDTPPSPADFQPWVVQNVDSMDDEMTARAVQAVRTMKE